MAEQLASDSSTQLMSGQRSDWRQRLNVNPSRMEQELAIKLQENGIQYLSQIEIPVTTADFYFLIGPRPLLVFVDGRVHLGRAQSLKDEELRSLLRKRGYKVLELVYEGYSVKTRDKLYEAMLGVLGKEH